MVRPLPLLLLAALPACSDPTSGGGGGSSSRTVWRVTALTTVAPTADDASVYFRDMRGVTSVNTSTGQPRWTTPPMGEDFGTAEGLALAGDVVVASVQVSAGSYALQALRRASGQPAWTFVPDSGVSLADASLSGDATTVYAATHAGGVVAVDASTGALRWAVPLSTGDYFATANEPLVRDGTVFVGLRTFEVDGPVPTTGALVALDAATGTERWRYTFEPATPGQSAGCCWQGMAISGSAVIASADDGRLYAFDAATGAVRWTGPALALDDTSIAAGDLRPIAVSGSTVIAGSRSGYVTGYDAATGAQRWQVNPQLGPAMGRVLADDEQVYVSFPRQLFGPTLPFPGPLAAFDAATGTEQWRSALGYVSPVLGDAYLYALGTYGLEALRK